jgi:hypothetical protein
MGKEDLGRKGIFDFVIVIQESYVKNVQRKFQQIVGIVVKS